MHRTPYMQCFCVWNDLQLLLLYLSWWTLRAAGESSSCPWAKRHFCSYLQKPVSIQFLHISVLYFSSESAAADVTAPGVAAVAVLADLSFFEVVFFFEVFFFDLAGAGAAVALAG